MRDPDWKIERAGRTWSQDEFYERLELLPEKIEVVRGRVLVNDDERLRMLGCLLEGIGADAAVRLGDPAVWRAAIAALEKQQ